MYSRFGYTFLNKNINFEFEIALVAYDKNLPRNARIRFAKTLFNTPNFQTMLKNTMRYGEMKPQRIL